MMTPLLTRELSLASLLSWICFGVGAEEVCLTKAQSKSINLCHYESWPSSVNPHTCQDSSEGFALQDFTIAPTSKGHTCGYIYGDYLNGSCLRSHVVSSAEFDAALFDLLEKVSGQHQIDASTTVEQFSYTLASSDSSVGNEKESSAFVSFRNVCKPVKKKDVQDSTDGVIRFCSANRAGRSTLYLTLLGGDNMTTPTDTPIQCRCTLTPTKTVVLKALDIRLQQKASRLCPQGIHLKISSSTRQEDLTCDGLYALYGLVPIFTSNEKITLDLRVPAGGFPTAVWIQADLDGGGAGDLIIGDCETYSVLSPEEFSEPDQEGTNIWIIIGVVVGLIVVCSTSAAIIAFFIIRRRRHQGEDIDPDTGHVYSVPGNHCPSMSKDSDFPVESPQTPPPVPDNPPPATRYQKSPFMAPPKPERSALLSSSEAPAEEYDRLSRDGKKEPAKAKGSIKGDGQKGSEKKKYSYDHLSLDDKNKATE